MLNCHDLFNLIEENKTTAVVSALSIAEVIQGPVKKGATDIVRQVREYLLNFPNMKCQAIDENVLELFGSDKRVGWPFLRVVDSLIISSGLYNEVDLIISNDRHFKKAVSKDLIVSFDNH